MNANSDLAAKVASVREKRLSTAPESVKGLLRRVFAGKQPRSACIKAFCLECQGFDREAITYCDCYACPLWNVRPFRKRQQP